MNYIRHLTGFFDRACKDHRLNPTHISIYMAIFQYWNLNRFKNPISISRSEIMELSKVSSKNTYHKCMKELDQFGFLRYDPSYHPLRGSWVYLFAFKTAEETNQYKNDTGNGQVPDKQEGGAEQAENQLSSEIYASGSIQAPLNIYKHSKLNKLSFSTAESTGQCQEKEEGTADENKNDVSPGAVKNNVKAAAGTDKNPPFTDGEVDSEAVQSKEPQKVPADIDVVIQFFLACRYPEGQAQKFFHYYSATGWKVGGKAPIENWHSAAHSWMLNPNNTSRNATSEQKHKPALHANQLHNHGNKDYSEPL